MACRQFDRFIWPKWNDPTGLLKACESKRYQIYSLFLSAHLMYWFRDVTGTNTKAPRGWNSENLTALVLPKRRRYRGCSCSTDVSVWRPKAATAPPRLLTKRENLQKQVCKQCHLTFTSYLANLTPSCSVCVICTWDLQFVFIVIKYRGIGINY